MISRSQRTNLALMLLFCILIAGFDCGMRHGDASGMHLQVVGLPFCGAAATVLPPMDLGHGHDGHGMVSAELGCILASSFAAIALAALFSLLGLLPVAAGSAPLSALIRQRPAPPWRPPAAPRAPPFLA